VGGRNAGKKLNGDKNGFGIGGNKYWANARVPETIIANNSNPQKSIKIYFIDLKPDLEKFFLNTNHPSL